MAFVLSLLSLLYSETRHSGMGVLDSYGFPRDAVEFWENFEGNEQYWEIKWGNFMQNFLLWLML